MRTGRRDPITQAPVYNYEMASIREHSAIIKQVDIFGHLVIALDEEGYISLSYISYEDQEEYKAYKIEEFAQRKVMLFQYDTSDQTLFIVECNLEKKIGL